MVSKRNLRGAEPLGYVKPPAPTLASCPLCGRQMVLGASIDEHHILPKSQGGKTKQQIHRICHRKIHATFSDRELAKNYSNWSALQQHPEIASFLVGG